MADLSFPLNPTLYQTYTANGKTWYWDGKTWIYGSGPSPSPQYVRSSVGLYLPFDGADLSTTITDNGPNAVVCTAYSQCKIKTAQSKFGGSSLFNDGSAGSGLMVPYAVGTWGNLSHQAENWTLGFWFYPLSLTGTQFLMNWGGGAGIAYARPELYLAGSSLVFAGSSNNSGYDIGAEGAGGTVTGTVNLNAWNHVEVTRNLRKQYLVFLNGVLGLTLTTTLSFHGLYNTNAQGIVLLSSIATAWGNANLTSGLNGYMDDFIYYAGVARHTANFTPPTSPAQLITPL